ncbi:MAG: ASCH domain-containing protein [Zetaproteobacteria bacterium]|nr:MAG: ASCH domain-containing protein [Zetaproteobacteria bacterium]
MEDHPEKTCSIDRLIRHPRLVAAALAGRKTEQRRDGVYGWPGERFTLQGVPFVCTALERQRLGDMDDADARAEGFPDLAAYREMILTLHRTMGWNPDALVWVHRFRRCDDTPAPSNEGEESA